MWVITSVRTGRGSMPRPVAAGRLVIGRDPEARPGGRTVPARQVAGSVARALSPCRRRSSPPGARSARRGSSRPVRPLADSRRVGWRRRPARPPPAWADDALMCAARPVLDGVDLQAASRPPSIHRHPASRRRRISSRQGPGSATATSSGRAQPALGSRDAQRVERAHRRPRPGGGTEAESTGPRAAAVHTHALAPRDRHSPAPRISAKIAPPFEAPVGQHQFGRPTSPADRGQV